MVNGFPTYDPPTTCALCGQPLKMRGENLYGWRTTSGRLYCSEFCADSEEEVRFQDKRSA
jgi:hypothetical protein